ncbi:hypothetical protein Tco_0053388 [Tanacetum coccineum]
MNECKSALVESNDLRDRCRSALHDQEIELEKYKKYKNCQLEKEEVERKLKDTLGLLTQQKFQSEEALKTQAYETFQFKEKNAELVHQSSLEHTRYDLLQKENKQLKRISKHDKKRILKNKLLGTSTDIDEQTELQCLYLEKIKECEHLKIELSKQTENCQEQLKNDNVWKQQESSSFRDQNEQYFFDKPSVVRQPNALRIPKPSVLGKPTPFSDSLERKTFSKTKPVTKTNVLESLSKPVTTRILPQNRNQAVKNKNVIKPRMYQIDTRTTQTRAPQLPQTSRNTNPRVSTSIGVIHNTSVSRPQLKSTQMKDKVMQTNSQVKLKERWK